MLAAITMADYGVLGLYLLVMVAIGLYFSREQHTSKDFFLAGRSMGWFPVGLSIMATLLSALSYSGIPGEGYYAGFQFLLLPLAVWLTLPILAMFVLPIYHGLGLYSVYEYLELRFDASTRFVSSLVFVAWRLLWLGGVLFAPCKVLVVAAGLNLPIWLLLLVLGLVSTLYTFLGGMKAVIWTDVIQSIVMVSGVFLIIGAVWANLDGGAERVGEIATELGRTKLADPRFSWTEYWSLWGILPHFVLSMLSFYVADQITAQRFFTARNLLEARRSFVLNCVSVSIMVPALMYVGVALLAYYHDHPQAIRPMWVVNVYRPPGVERPAGGSITFPETREKVVIDAKTGKPRLDPQTNQPLKDPTDGQPLIDWQHDQLTPETVRELVSEGRILRPNTNEPFDNADELIRPGVQGAGGEQIDVERLAKRSPPKGKLERGEVILNTKAKDELMPRFIAEHLPVGIAGLIMAALFAASMSSMDSGLNSLCTLLIVDFHRRLGWGRTWLAGRLNKQADELTEADELKLGRPLVLVIGVAATLFSLVVSQVDDIFTIMIAIVNTFGGPLLGIFLLGIFTRRTTAASALTALVLGTLFTLWMMLANSYDSLAWLWPWRQKLGSVWPLTFGVLFTLVVGYGLSMFLGRRKSKEELRGLVVGVGELGVRELEMDHLDLGDMDVPSPDDNEDRWR